jgi:hypothetical protein
MDVKPTGFTNFKNFTEWLKTSLNFQDNLFVTWIVNMNGTLF